MTDLDAIPFHHPDEPAPTLSGAVGRKRCTRHRWVDTVQVLADGSIIPLTRKSVCGDCDAVKDEARSRRGKSSRDYGNRAELKVSRVYGGTKIGHAGGPVDVQGKEWNTQVKTHRRLPPVEWRKAFAAMSASRERLPRLLLRFLPGASLPPDDYVVIPGKVWIDWFGKDE